MRNLGREFSDKKVCVKVRNVEDIEKLMKIINSDLFEDVSIVNSKLYHGVYYDWISKGIELSIGKINDQVEVLSDGLFKNYEKVECDEFIENLKEW